MLKLSALFMCLFACVVYGEPSIKAYVVDNAKKLEQLIDKKNSTKAPFDLSEMFSEHVEDVNKLLSDLKDDSFEYSKNEEKKQEVVSQIAKHMEILQKLLSIMNNNSPSEALNRFCISNSNGPFHDAICNRPVRKKFRLEKKTDLQPAVPSAERRARSIDYDHSECEERVN